jgi:hypothetical protein
MPLCPTCVEFSPVNENDLSKGRSHHGHYIQTLTDLLDEVKEEKRRVKNDITDRERKLAAAIDYYQGIRDIYTEQRDLFLKKVTADFDILMRMLERRKMEMQQKIAQTYNPKIDFAANLATGLKVFKDSLLKINTADVRIDLDQVQLNAQLEFRVHEINTELNLQVKGNELDFTDSQLVNNPVPKMKSLIP